MFYHLPTRHSLGTFYFTPTRLLSLKSIFSQNHNPHHCYSRGIPLARMKCRWHKRRWSAGGTKRDEVQVAQEGMKCRWHLEEDNVQGARWNKDGLPDVSADGTGWVMLCRWRWVIRKRNYMHRAHKGKVRVAPRKARINAPALHLLLCHLHFIFSCATCTSSLFVPPAHYPPPSAICTS